MFLICATAIIVSENTFFFGAAGCRDTRTLYSFLIQIFTHLDMISVSQWSERNGEGYIGVTTGNWFWC